MQNGRQARGYTGPGRVCQFFLRGNCRFQDECFNLHTKNPENGTSATLSGGSSDIPSHAPVTEKVLCHSGGSSDTPAHVPVTERVPGGSGKVCPFYQKGYCRYEDNCWNLHIVVQGRTNDSSSQGNNENLGGRPCTYFLQGTCRYGTECRNLHTGQPAPATSAPVVDLAMDMSHLNLKDLVPGNSEAILAAWST